MKSRVMCGVSPSPRFGVGAARCRHDHPQGASTSDVFKCGVCDLCFLSSRRADWAWVCPMLEGMANDQCFGDFMKFQWGHIT